MTKPFTYSIYCRPTRQYYYGVRFARGCDPLDLWTKYFTSSIYVKKLILLHGKESFDIKIRKVFSDANSAKIWEAKFLTKIKASQREDFINKYDFMFFDLKNRCWINNGLKSKQIDVALLQDYLNDGWISGRIFTESHKNNISLNAKQRYKNIQNTPMFGKTQSDQSKEKNRRQQLSRPKATDEFREKLSASIGKGYYVDGIRYNSQRQASKILGIPRSKIKGSQLPS